MGTNAVKIVTVFRSGGDFTHYHVRWFKRQCDEHHPGVPFVCLSDEPIEGVKFIFMRYDWPGWWGKIELFEHFNNALFFDLDTVLLQPVWDILDHNPKGLMALRKLSGLLDGDPDSIGSGVMRWNCDLSGITYAFRHDPDRYMAECNHKFNWGDQGFILSQVDRFEYLQEQFPNTVMSYKREDGLNMGRKPLPEWCRILCFHGQPRPWDVDEEYVPKL